MGGIQHIICSATMTINKLGRVTPRQSKYLAKKKKTLDDVESTLDALCRTLLFRSKHPKVIDLTDETNQAALTMIDGVVDLSNMPKTLSERLARCKAEEKDLYAYYYLQ